MMQLNWGGKIILGLLGMLVGGPIGLGIGLFVGHMLDKGAAHLKDELMPRYAELIYNGFWWSPEREMLQAAIDHSQRWVTGEVTLKLYKGQAYLTGRSSPYSLYREDIVTFEDDHGAYDQKDAEGFIKLNALRLRLLAGRDRKFGKN